MNKKSITKKLIQSVILFTFFLLIYKLSLLKTNDLKSKKSFWSQIIKILLDNNIYDGINFEKDFLIRLNKNVNLDLYDMKSLISRSEIRYFDIIKNKHKKFIKNIPKTIPTNIYNRGTSGIVLLGGGKFTWLSHIAIKTLRNFGSKLPIELLLPKKQDYKNEINYCSKIKKELNAKCIVIEDFFDFKFENTTITFNSYSFKPLSILISSFEKILYLDSDNFLVMNPDLLFDSNLFKEYGLILWPDYWKRSISPKFYDLAEIPINLEKKVRYDQFNMYSNEKIDIVKVNNYSFHDFEGTIPDLSTESGQIFIDKSKHFDTLILSLYYNTYGNKFYYPLFTQGQQGEGDKETYASASYALNKKFYQIFSNILTKGYVNEKNVFRGVAMGQKKPDVDFNEMKKIQKLFDQIKPNKLNENEFSTIKNHMKKSVDEDLFSIHCNFPKLDIIELINNNDLYDSKNNKLKYRLYNNFIATKKEKNKITKFDFELFIWKTMYNELCSNKNNFFYFKNKNTDFYCELSKNQINFLKN